MCGRYQLAVEASALSASHRNAKWVASHAEQQHKPRQQVRPTTHAPVLLYEGSSPTFHLMKWGFSRAGSLLINARKETVLQLPTFRTQMSQRCAIPTTGFFEWQKDLGPGKSSKTPFLIRSLVNASYEEASITYMAGIYRREPQGAENVHTFVVLTENAAPELDWLHNRQPVFLRDEKQIQTWLSHDVPAYDAVGVLDDGTGFSWWRMKSDLSDKFRGKILKQKGLDAFFSPKRRTKKDTDLKAKSPLRKQNKNPLKKKSTSAQSHASSSKTHLKQEETERSIKST